MNGEIVSRGPITVIGKAGRGSAGCGASWIKPLWQAANRDFAEISHLADRDENGKPRSLWGAMRNRDGSFRPWESEGQYLAGVEALPDGEAPGSWEKWTIPACKWLVLPCTEANCGEVLTEAVTKLLPKQGFSLCGAVQERYDPGYDGGFWLWLPVGRLGDGQA